MEVNNESKLTERWKYLKIPKRQSEEMGNPTDPTDQGKI